MIRRYDGEVAELLVDHMSETPGEGDTAVWVDLLGLQRAMAAALVRAYGQGKWEDWFCPICGAYSGCSHYEPRETYESPVRKP